MTAPKHYNMPRRRYRRVRNEDRDRLINRYEEGQDFTDAAFNLGIPRTTAYGIIRRFVETGDRYPTVGRGGRVKVQGSMFCQLNLRRKE